MPAAVGIPYTFRSSGTDLGEYGRYEYASFRTDGWLRTWRWSQLEPGGENACAKGPQLESFCFGPRTDDQVFIWDPALEELAGDFWEMIDDSLHLVPGAWVDDED